jgi:hypothetical protein
VFLREQTSLSSPSYIRLVPPPALAFELAHIRRTPTGRTIGLVRLPKATTPCQ